MPLTKWNETYSVGVDELDQQHQKLVKMLNALHEATLDGQSQHIIVPILKGLVAYTKVHFATEERMLAQAGYPELEAHQKEHAYFIKNVQGFHKSLEDGAPTLSNDIMEFLRHWVINHILNNDKKYSRCLNRTAAV